MQKNINSINESNDIGLPSLILGFISHRLGDYISAIEYFTTAILYETQMDYLNQRSMDISYNGRSNSRYRNQDFKGAIEDKRHAKAIRLREESEISISKNYFTSRLLRDSKSLGEWN